MESEGKKMPPPSRYKVMVYGSGAQSARVCEWVSTRRADFYIRIVRALRQYDFKSAKMINFHIFCSVLSSLTPSTNLIDDDDDFIDFLSKVAVVKRHLCV